MGHKCFISFKKEDESYKKASGDITYGDNSIIVVEVPVDQTGYVTITMTDLVEGSLSLELEVTQITPAGIFGRDDYESEDLWDADYDSIFNISVIEYVSDSNWDENGNHGINLNIDGYTGDECWDGTSGSGDMDRDDYPDDENNAVYDACYDVVCMLEHACRFVLILGIFQRIEYCSAVFHE